MFSPLDEALKRIEECRRTRAEMLDLSNLDLLEIPKEVFELFWLRKLDVSHGEIFTYGSLKTISPAIEQLTTLTDLNISWNRFSDLSCLNSIPQLQLLNCSFNPLSDLSDLHYVPQLESLNCRSKQVIDLSGLVHVPQLRSISCGFQRCGLGILAHMAQLQLLDCSVNQLSDLSGLIHVPQLQSLNCSVNQLSDLSGLIHVPQLQSLNCSVNQLSDLSGLIHVPQLQSLNCGLNHLKNLSSLEHVSLIQCLNCNSNDLSDLSDLEYVPQLLSLNCSFNQLSELSFLEYVPHLQCLNCRSNQLSDLSCLEYVPQLHSLNCSLNRLSDLRGLEHVPQLQSLFGSSNYLKNIEQLYELITSEQLDHLQLFDNQIHGIPPVIFGDLFHDCLEGLANYLGAFAKGVVNKNQLKVQFIGNGRVGKTTLAYALEHKKGPDKHFKSTHGITIKEIPHQLSPEELLVMLQLWDFGGQEIYHATHRLFLDDDCLYLLLWAEDTEEYPDETRHPATYWLDLIRDLAPNSPVVLVKNQIDRADDGSDTPPDLELSAIGNEQIKAKVKVSALKYWGVADSLSGAINYLLRQLQYRAQLKLPKSWVDVETALKALKPEKTIPFAHFEQLCIRNGVTDPHWFVEYLHKTGVLFYREDTFQNQIILDQNWVIEAVYHLFDPNKRFRQQIKARDGRFDDFDLANFWSDIEAIERNIYLDFMEGCGICYQPASDIRQKNIQRGERSFILPALLPETRPGTAFWSENDEQDWLYRVSYPFLHRGIKEHLIGHLGKGSNASVPWLEGIRCTFPYGELLLECQYENSELSRKGALHFQLRGKRLDKLLHEMRKLVREVSPHEQFVESLFQAGETAQLEEFNYQQDNQQEQSTMPKKVKLFISYAHEDEDYRKELDKRLRGIQRKLPLEFWHDRDLLAGEQVHDTILQELEVADIVVLLISPDFIDSDYCFTHEMEVALKQYEEKKNIVIPVIIRETEDWHSFKIGNHVALPTDGKPLCDWDHADKFWADVQKGIRKQVEKYIA